LLLVSRHGVLPRSADEDRRRSGQDQDGDRHDHRRVHGVDEGVGEYMVGDRLDLGRQLEAGA